MSAWLEEDFGVRKDSMRQIEVWWLPPCRNGSLIIPVGLLAFWRVSLLASFGVTRLSPYAALVTFDAHMFV